MLDTLQKHRLATLWKDENFQYYRQTIVASALEELQKSIMQMPATTPEELAKVQAKILGYQEGKKLLEYIFTSLAEVRSTPPVG